MNPLSEVLVFFLSVVALVLSIAMLLAQLRLFSIDKTLKAILAELRKASQPAGPPTPETDAELARRRAAIADVQNSWLIK
jgi:hypothetical protein